MKQKVYVVFTSLESLGNVSPYNIIGVFSNQDDALRCVNHYNSYHTFSAHSKEFIVQ